MNAPVLRSSTAADLRPVTRADVPRVVELVRTVLAEFGLEFGVGSPTDEQIEQLPDSYTECGGIFWVAEKDGEFIGTCGVYPLGSRVFELRKMYLRPAARGLGIGQRLLDESIAFARERGGSMLVLDTVDGMHGAIRLYERNGFVRDDAHLRGSRCTRAYRLDL